MRGINISKFKSTNDKKNALYNDFSAADGIENKTKAHAVAFLLFPSTKKL